jgi:hypothetical protein
MAIECHGINGINLVQSKEPFSLFDRKVTVAPKTFEKLRILNLKKRILGHPTENHPVWVAATADKAELNCLTCHESHSASTGGIVQFPLAHPQTIGFSAVDEIKYFQKSLGHLGRRLHDRTGSVCLPISSL